MASKPTVTLTFAGDEQRLSKSITNVADSTEHMGRKVAESSDKMRHSARSAEDLADKTDVVETRSQGFADVISGVRDGLAAWGDDSLSTGEKMQQLGMAGADLAGGMTNFLIPAVSSLATFMKGPLLSAFSFVAAHPLVFALLALAAVLVLLWTRSETFRRIVIDAFNAVAHWTMAVLGGAWDWLVGKFSQFVQFHEAMRNRIIDVFNTIAGAIMGAFRAAFNFVSRAWNNTVGSLSWSVPSWVPGLGGASISAPRLPTFHAGGVVPGLPGQEVLAVLQAGERVTPTAGRPAEVRVTFAGNVDGAFASAFMKLVRAGQIQLSAA